MSRGTRIIPREVADWFWPDGLEGHDTRIFPLLERSGWTHSGQWWLPPSGREYRCVCHSARRALIAEYEAAQARLREDDDE
jgi:hypothetical protein